MERKVIWREGETCAWGLEGRSLRNTKNGSRSGIFLDCKEIAKREGQRLSCSLVSVVKVIRVSGFSWF